MESHQTNNPPPSETTDETPATVAKKSKPGNAGHSPLPSWTRTYSPLKVGKRACFDCNHILSPLQEFCPNCGSFQPPEAITVLGLDTSTIGTFLNQQREKPAFWPTIETSGLLLIGLFALVAFYSIPALLLTKLLLSPMLIVLYFFLGQRLALNGQAFKWEKYIRANRYRSTFLQLEKQIKRRMAEIEKKLEELDHLQERTSGFSNATGQEAVNSLLENAGVALKEKLREFRAQWWNLLLLQWNNRFTGIGVQGNQDGMKNDVERVEEYVYIGHNYIQQLKKDPLLSPEKSRELIIRVQEGIATLSKIQEVVVAQEAIALVKGVKPLHTGIPEETTVEGRISELCQNSALVSLESFTDVISRLDEEYSRINIERKIAKDTKTLLKE